MIGKPLLTLYLANSVLELSTSSKINELYKLKSETVTFTTVSLVSGVTIASGTTGISAIWLEFTGTL